MASKSKRTSTVKGPARNAESSNERTDSSVESKTDSANNDKVEAEDVIYFPDEAKMGPPAIAEGENTRNYVDLYNQIRSAINAEIPVYLRESAFLFEIWSRDITDLTWETMRWRRYKAEILRQGSEDVVDEIAGAPSRTFDEFGAERARLRERTMRERFEAKLPLDDVHARAFVKMLKEVEHLDMMTMRAEMRRAAIFREIERFRAGADKRWRDSNEEFQQSLLTRLRPHPER